MVPIHRTTKPNFHFQYFAKFAIITISQFIIYKYNIHVYYITFPIISHSKMESLLFPLTFGLEIHVIRVDLKTEKAFI